MLRVGRDCFRETSMDGFSIKAHRLLRNIWAGHFDNADSHLGPPENLILWRGRKMFSEELDVAVKVVHLACYLCQKGQEGLNSNRCERVKSKDDGSLVTIVENRKWRNPEFPFRWKVWISFSWNF
ncbi:3'(2'),5'-bisphosphate nucleotidase [Sarracenia purpurea var. burkii]